MSEIARISRVLVGMDFDEASTSALKVAEVLKECVHPMSFVPLSEGIFERSSS